MLAAIDRADLRTRSTLARWMREHHLAFASRLNERTPDWTVLAKIFADAGLTDKRGNPPKAETARKTWQRVRKEVAARSATSQQQPVPAAPAVPPPATPPAIVQPPGQVPIDDGAAADEEYESRPRYVFKPGKIRE